MPHPVPIIIGTTLAVIGSGYAFKKFIYDPHLAPFIDALIAQHRELGQQRDGYEPIAVPVQASAPAPAPAPAPHAHAVPPHSNGAPSSGRSSAVDSGQHRISRRRRPAEMYELDDARIMCDERDIGCIPPASSPAMSARANPPPYHQQHPEQPVPLQKNTYQPRQMMPPSTIGQSPIHRPAMTQRQRPVVVHPTPRRIPPSPILINMDSVTDIKLAEHPDKTPVAPRPAAMDKSETNEKAGQAALGGDTPLIKRPAVQVGDSEANATPDPIAIMPSPSMIRQSSQVTIGANVVIGGNILISGSPVSAHGLVSPPAEPISLSPSPSPSSVSDLSHLSQISRISSSTSHRPDDLDIISISGTTTSYVDAETYTPRSPRSMVSTPLSRAMSPPVHIDAIALADYGPPLSTENLSLASLGPPLSVPVALSTPSLSSWGEDEQWRSDSEWDAISEVGQR